MRLAKELKEKVENAKTREEAKKIIEESGIILDDEELNQVSGGEMTHDHRLKPIT